MRILAPGVIASFLFLSLPAAAAGASPGYLGTSLPGDFLPFAADSPWNTPIGAAPEIDRFSNIMVGNLVMTSGILRWSNTKWTIPLHVIDAGASPKHHVRTTAAYINPVIDPDNDGVAMGIPIPPEAWADPQDDAHMLLVDPALGRTWDFSFARKQPDGSWKASKIDTWELDGPGWRKYRPGDRDWANGARSGGAPLIAGLIRPEELAAGRIRHALAAATPINRDATYQGGRMEFCSPPASRSDGTHTGYQFIPMGARLQLDPALDLTTLGLSPEVEVIARAMQKYGLIVVEGSAVFKIYFQNVGPGAEAYEPFDFTTIESIPIDRLRVLECNIKTRQ